MNQQTTNLPWKISKTKKRLSEDSWELFQKLALLGLFFFLGLSLKLFSLSWPLGLLPGKIPIIPLEKSITHRSSLEMGEETLTIALTAKGFYVAQLQEFTQNYTDVRNKIFIPHRGSFLQHEKLKEAIHFFQKQNPQKSPLAIFLPHFQTPLVIVLQILSFLKKTGPFGQVVLGGGLTL